MNEVWFGDHHQFISTHAPAGGATSRSQKSAPSDAIFLLTPLREGRLRPLSLDDPEP